MTEKHDELKLRATGWLREMGFNDIEFEVHIANPETGKTWCGSFVIDVVGRKEGEKVAVECGGSRVKKLIDIHIYFDKIYIWPYGANEPYLWAHDINVCQNCGHNIGYLSTRLMV